MNVRTHTRWMRSSPSPSLSPSPGRCCNFYRGPLGQPDMVRARTVSDARHASDTALPRAADTRRTLSETDEYWPRSIRRVSGVKHCSGPHCVGLLCAACPTVRFLGIPRKRRFLKSADTKYIIFLFNKLWKRMDAKHCTIQCHPTARY